jgi:hypothetical protein
MELQEECDGVVILMQKKAGGLEWFAPDGMELQTLVYILWKALNVFGR